MDDSECSIDSIKLLDNRCCLSKIIGSLVELLSSLIMIPNGSSLNLPSFLTHYYYLSISFQMSLLSVDGRYTQHLTVNTLVAISEFLLTSVCF